MPVPAPVTARPAAPFAAWLLAGAGWTGWVVFAASAGFVGGGAGEWWFGFAVGAAFALSVPQVLVGAAALFSLPLVRRWRDRTFADWAWVAGTAAWAQAVGLLTAALAPGDAPALAFVSGAFGATLAHLPATAVVLRHRPALSGVAALALAALVGLDVVFVAVVFGPSWLP